jgi:hypothetical protein
VFWLLVWWAVHIRDPDNSTVSTIPNKVWDDLIGVDLKEKKDSRSSFLVQLEEDEGQWLDPHYQGLDELFRQMALQLSGDYHWAHEKTAECPVEMKDPEFLSEALQRLIFKFLLQNADKPFMSSEKHPQHRQTARQFERAADLSAFEVSASTWTLTKRTRDAVGCNGERGSPVS